MTSTLVIIPCGRAKIWDKSPDAGPVPAPHAYIGAPFTVNRRYAEASGSEWVILSAKYGFLRPTDLVPGPYEVTFKRPASNPVGVAVLQDQVRQMQLDRYAEVVGLGGKEYRTAVEAAFAGLAVRLRFPFTGLPIGKAMGTTKAATLRANDD